MNYLHVSGNMIELPSQGKPYDLDAVPLIQGTSVRAKLFLTENQRDFRAVLGSKDIYKAYRLLLDQLMVEPRCNPDPLLLTDVLAILYLVKIFSWGALTKYEYTCRCGQSNSHELDMSSLMVTYAEEIPNYSAAGIELELTDHKITYHLPTLGDEKKVSNYINHLRKTDRLKGEGVDEQYIRMAQMIDSIDGDEKLSLQAKFNHVMKWRIEDQEYFNEDSAKRDTGIVLDQVDTTCTNCGALNVINLGITPDFFRPGIRRSGADRKENKVDDVQELHV